MEKVELSRLPVAAVKAACTNPATLSIINTTKAFSSMPKEELVFILLSIIYAFEESGQQRLDIMSAFVDAYKKGNVTGEKSTDGDSYILYQTGTISVKLGL